LKKLTFGFLVLALSFFIFTGKASACDKERCSWKLKGSYTIDYTLTGGGIYTHTYTIDKMDKKTGEFSGTGVYNVDPSYTETITGKITGSDIVFHIVYTGTNAGYTVDAIGKIDNDGNLTGTATGPGQTFTWVVSSGKAIKSKDCDRRGKHEEDRFGEHHGDKNDNDELYNVGGSDD